MNDPRVPVCKRSEYDFRFENVRGMTFAHSSVNRWGARVKQKWLADWDFLFALHGGPIYALHNPADDMPKRKFLGMAKFQFLKAIETVDGARHVFVRSE